MTYNLPKRTKQLLRIISPWLCCYFRWLLSSLTTASPRGGGNYPETAAKDVDWDLTFGMKIPYTHNYGGTSYALNMGLEYTLALTGNTLTKQMGLPPTAAGTMSQTDARVMINDIISNDMANAINRTNNNNPNWKNSFYIPSRLTTFSGVNPIDAGAFEKLSSCSRCDFVYI